MLAAAGKLDLRPARGVAREGPEGHRAAEQRPRGPAHLDAGRCEHAPQRLPAAAARPDADVAGGLRLRRAGHGDRQPRHDHGRHRRPSTCSTTRSCGGSRWPWPSGCSGGPSSDDAGRVDLAYRLTLGRPATPKEIERAQRLPRRLRGRRARAIASTPSRCRREPSTRSRSPRRRRRRASRRPPVNPDEVDHVRRAGQGRSRPAARRRGPPPGPASARPCWAAPSSATSSERVMTSIDTTCCPRVMKDRSMSNPSIRSRPLGTRLSRRQVLKTAGTGFGYLALAGLLGQKSARAAAGGAGRRPGAAGARSRRTSRPRPSGSSSCS